MIEAQRLTKFYGPTRAVHDLSFRVEKGQVVGFLGPNGAGKSTTIRMLTGFTPPTQGLATIDGHDILTARKSARRAIGYLPESTPLYPELRVTEYLHHRGRLMGMSRNQRRQRIDAVIEQCNLVPMRKRTIGRLSKGNRQRVGLAQALLHDPPVLVLDEPTSGFDPSQLNQFRDLLARLKGQHTILISTHILPEVEQTADRVLIIAHGQLVAQGTPDELRQRVGGQRRVHVTVPGEWGVVRAALAELPEVKAVDAKAGEGIIRASVTPHSGKENVVAAAVGQLALSRGWALRELHVEKPSLHALFGELVSMSTTKGKPDKQAQDDMEGIS